MDASPQRIVLAAIVLTALLAAGCSTCSTRLQMKALRLHALGGCEILEHVHGDACSAEVERRISGCAGPFLAQENEIEDFYECLGFIEPELPDVLAAPTELGRCEAPDIDMELSFSLASRTPRDGSTQQVIDGKTWFVSTTAAALKQDLRQVRLEERGETLFLVLEFSEEAAKRLEAITGANVGESMIIALNGEVTAIGITAAVAGPEYTLYAPTARLEDYCAAR